MLSQRLLEEILPVSCLWGNRSRSTLNKSIGSSLQPAVYRRAGICMSFIHSLSLTHNHIVPSMRTLIDVCLASIFDRIGKVWPLATSRRALREHTRVLHLKTDYLKKSWSNTSTSSECYRVGINTSDPCCPTRWRQQRKYRSVNP